MTAEAATPSGQAGPSGAAGSSALRGVARSGAVSTVGSLATSVLGFLVVVQVSRGLGAAGAGAFAVAVAIAMVLGIAGRLGTDTAMVRTVPRLRELGRQADIRIAVRTALVPVGVVTSVLAAVLCWVAPWVAPALFGDIPAEQSTALMRVAALTVPLGAACYVALQAISGLGTIVPLTVVESITKPAARCLFIAVALLAGAEVFGVTVAWALPMLLGAVMAGWVLRQKLRRLPLTGAAEPDPVATRREVWRFAGPRGVAAVFEVAGLHIGVVLLSALAGAAAAGVYSSVLRLALAGMLGLQALRLAVAPQISKMLTEGDIAGVEQVHRASTVWVALVSFPLFLVLLSWPSQVLTVFGPEFQAGTVALSVLAAALLLNVATGNVATVLLMSGRSAITLGVTIVSLGIGVLLTVLLGPLYGVLGAAIAKATSTVFENVAVAVAVRRKVGVRTLSRPLGLAVAAGVACYAVPAAVLHAVGAVGAGTDGIPLAAGTVLVASVVYAVLVWRARNHYELSALAAVLPARFTRRLRGAVGAQEKDR